MKLTYLTRYTIRLRIATVKRDSTAKQIQKYMAAAKLRDSKLGKKLLSEQRATPATVQTPNSLPQNEA